MGHGWYVTTLCYSATAILMITVGSYTYNIPACISDGEYLLRIQSLAIHNPWPSGIPQVPASSNTTPSYCQSS